MKKLYISKTFLKRLVRGGTPLILPPLGPPRQKPSKESGIFQSHDTIYFVNFRGGRMAQRPPPPFPPPLNTLLTVFHLFCDMIIIGKESSIAFSAF